MEYVREWEQVIFGITSPLWGYIILQTKDFHYVDIFVVNFLSALLIYFNTRAYFKCQFCLVFGASCLLMARYIEETYVATTVIACILISWNTWYLDYELPPPYSVVANSIIFLFFRRFNVSERFVTHFYELVVGLRYYLFVERRRTTKFILLFPMISTMSYLTSDKVSEALVFVAYSILFAFIQILDYYDRN